MRQPRNFATRRTLITPIVGAFSCSDPGSCLPNIPAEQPAGAVAFALGRRYGNFAAADIAPVVTNDRSNAKRWEQLLGFVIGGRQGRRRRDCSSLEPDGRAVGSLLDEGAAKRNCGHKGQPAAGTMIGATPGLVGLAAKAGANAMTRGNVSALRGTIYGRAVPPPAPPDPTPFPQLTFSPQTLVQFPALAGVGS